MAQPCFVLVSALNQATSKTPGTLRTKTEKYTHRPLQERGQDSILHGTAESSKHIYKRPFVLRSRSFYKVHKAGIIKTISPILLGGGGTQRNRTLGSLHTASPRLPGLPPEPACLPSTAHTSGWWRAHLSAE